ncbi:MAG: ATP-binding protein [Candidatus Woesearchaeota archaeon]
MAFVGRKKELAIVREVVASEKAELLILYGRRRLGKSTLLKKAIEKEPSAIYFQFFEESAEKNLHFFQEVLQSHFQNPLFAQVRASSWSSYFSLVKDSIPENTLFIFDEFSYLIEQSRAIPSHFQKIYDEVLKPKNCKLILCGSSTSIMTELLEYKSPLYGRRTRSLELKEFSLKEISQFLAHITQKKELLSYAAIFGGIPYYLEQINQKQSFEQNFKELFFEQKSFFHDEIKFLLKEEVREMRNYFAILQAIGFGKVLFSQIQQDALIEKSSLSKYLFVLEQIGVIKQQRSFFDKQHAKNRRYIIEDFFIHFWFTVFGRETGNLQNKKIQENIINQRLAQYLGLAFEKICRNALASKYEKIGTFFRGIEIDILAKNNTKIDVFECKFSESISRKALLEKMHEKIKQLPQGYTYTPHIICLEKKDLDFLFSL